MKQKKTNTFQQFLNAQVHAAPLAMFRLLFGAMMFASTLRFILKGWVYDLYIKPQFYFTYYGFDWVKPLGATGMYVLFAVMAIAALMVMLGYKYRLAAIAFFITFTYVELIDKSNYLNHYYFVSIVSFILILLPAGNYFSIDTYLKPSTSTTHIPRWIILVIQLQMGLVYFFAGVAKLNPDWLINALPLRIWLPPHTNLPIIGGFMEQLWVAYLFSWFGAIYDLSIPFLLLFKRTRIVAYGLVIIFHIATAILFPIGMFPYIMIICTLIFFSEKFHLQCISVIKRLLGRNQSEAPSSDIKPYVFSPALKQFLTTILIIHFSIQLFLPFRYMLYPGKLFWTEQGYRFSWRVMLMEKAGKTFFYVKDKATKKSGEVMMNEILTPNQEKMMATQPDMILQYAHFLKQQYQKQGIQNPEIRVLSYVSLNGSGSRLFIDSSIDLTTQQENFRHKTWILPFNNN